MLVFVQSKERARELFHELVYEGINVDVIHAERTQQQVPPQTLQQVKASSASWLYCLFYFHQRDNVVNSFRSGKIWVLICTALLARGIDFKGVNLVLNYDFPTSAVEYIHRIGESLLRSAFIGSILVPRKSFRKKIISRSFGLVVFCGFCTRLSLAHLTLCSFVFVPKVEVVELDIKERPSPSSQKMTNHCCAGTRTLQ